MGYRKRVQSRVAGQQTISFWATRVEEIFGGRGIRRGGMQIAAVVKQGWGWGPGNKAIVLACHYTIVVSLSLHKR